jgi:hypothetical protein
MDNPAAVPLEDDQPAKIDGSRIAGNNLDLRYRGIRRPHTPPGYGNPYPGTGPDGFREKPEDIVIRHHD